MIYTWIGRAVVGFARRRYRRQIRVGFGIALALGATAALAGFVAATRNVPEG